MPKKWVSSRPCDHGARSDCYLHSHSGSFHLRCSHLSSQPRVKPGDGKAMLSRRTQVSNTLLIRTILLWERNWSRQRRKLSSQGKPSEVKKGLGETALCWHLLGFPVSCGVWWPCVGVYVLSSGATVGFKETKPCGSGSPFSPHSTGHVWLSAYSHPRRL